MELVDVGQPGAGGPEHQVGVAARADQREGAQEAIRGEVLAGGRELALVRSRSAAGSRRQAGSTFRNVNLTKLRFMARTSIYAALIAGLWRSRSPAGVPLPSAAASARAPRSCSGPGPQPLAEAARCSSASAQVPGSTAFGFMSLDPGLLHARAGAARHQRGRAHHDLPLRRGAADRTCGSLARTARIIGVGRDRRARARRRPPTSCPGLLGAAVARRRARRLRRGRARRATARRSWPPIAPGSVERVVAGAARRCRPRPRAAVADDRPAGREAAAGPPGVGRWRRCSRRAAPPDLVFVVQDPSRVTGACSRSAPPGLRDGTDLRSDSTRTEGVVISTDVAPTVLERLGVDVPDDMSGEPIEARGDREPGRPVGAAQPAHGLGPAALGGDAGWA